MLSLGEVGVCRTTDWLAGWPERIRFRFSAATVAGRLLISSQRLRPTRRKASRRMSPALIPFRGRRGTPSGRRAGRAARAQKQGGGSKCEWVNVAANLRCWRLGRRAVCAAVEAAPGERRNCSQWSSAAASQLSGARAHALAASAQAGGEVALTSGRALRKAPPPAPLTQQAASSPRGRRPARAGEVATRS